MTLNENELKVSVIAVRDKAGEIVIATDEEFSLAGEMLSNIKTVRKNVVDFFADMKDSAYRSWKTVCEKEKSYTDPADEAMKELESKRKGYRAVLAERAEEARKREAAIHIANMQKHMDEAAKAELDGDLFKANREFVAAQIFESAPVVSVAQPPKTDGLILKKVWTFEVEDLSKVPATMNGFALLKLDETMVRTLIRAGIRDIPGIRIFQDERESASR